MRTFILSLLAVSLVGCFGQTYSATKVGPDRYTIVSHGFESGPENYTHVLERAYGSCITAGYKDYTITNVAFEQKRVVAFVKCEQEVKAPEVQSVASKSSEPSTMDELSKLYADAKRKWEER